MSRIFVRNRAMAQLRVAVLGCIALTFSSLAMAQAGQLDPTFGDQGIFITNFTIGPDINNAVALQSDGKIVVAGQFISCSSCDPMGALLRVTSKGVIDTSFGTNGLVTNTFGIDVETIVVGLAVQPDGKIVASATGLPDGDVVARFNTDGSVDTSFGNSGFANLSLANTGPLVIQPDGKILVLGTQLARLDGDGQLDSSFGNGGRALLLQQGQTLALQADGKILVASVGFGGPPGVVGTEENFPGVAGVLARYNANGSVDKGFGIGGETAVVTSPYALAIQSDGKILAGGTVVGGLSSTFPNPSAFGVARYNSDGTLDTTFGAHGGVITPFPNMNDSTAFGLAVQSNGEVVAAGQAGNVGPLTSSIGLARYTEACHLDRAFGNKGLVTTSISGSSLAFASGVVLQTDGKIIAAGSASGQFVIARYLGQ
jgi:uncharacterized delta-60 repeat protein